MSSSPPVITGRDRAIVAGLLLVLAVVAVGILAPARPTPSTAGRTEASASPVGASSAAVAARPIRLGVVGIPSAVNPLFAATRVDQELVGLVFSGLVRLGAGQTLEPGLATRWSASEDGRAWTFTLRPDARWHDGRPVTARDVVFTIGILRDPAYTGPGASSWRDVTATEVDPLTVRFDLGTPIGGFLQAATQPLLPAHLLADVPLADLPAHGFNRAPIGTGPYRLTSLDGERAILEPVATPGPRASQRPSAPAPASAPADASPTGMEVRFYPDSATLAAAFDDEGLDAASGLSPAEAIGLASTPDARLLRYPTSTLTAVLFNLRPSNPALRDARVRTALLRAIDRRGLIGAAWAGQAEVAAAAIPSVSWAFDPAASRAVSFSRDGARQALLDAGWGELDDGLVAPGSNERFGFELLSPDVATNPGTFTAAAEIAADWTALGLDVTPVALPPGELVSERLRTANFAAAVVDINVGLDPDLYPLLASTQGTSVGLNVSGLVDRELDTLLEKARAPGSDAARRAAYRALQVRLAERQYLLPIAFRDELVVARDTLVGPRIRQIGGVGDRFWDVLSWRLAADR